MWKPTDRILICEDDVNDALLLQLAMKKIGIPAPMQIVENGEQAINYLRGIDSFADRRVYPFPTVIMTDLKMPRVSGFEVLAFMKDAPECSIIPSIVWSSSDHPDDVIKAYELGASCYLKKPIDTSAWAEMIDLLFRFWSACEKPPVKAGNCY